MTCPTCQFDNEDDAETCKACGQVLGGDGGELKLGSLVAERYEIRRLLGRGGMGVVYEAHDRLLEETVALKVLRKEAMSKELARRFREEIKLARKVSHRNVCRIHEYAETEGLRYISMAYVDGVDLKRILRKQGPLAMKDALSVARDSAAGLQAIHDEGIVHRDLKTANIMRDQKGVVRLMDFGIAKSSDASSGMTATGVIVGTPDYMSPEQATGAGLDARSDVYSLGVVIYELFTARVPFHADTPMATLLRHIQEPLQLDVGLATRIPLPVRPLLQKAMAKSPADRFGSARELGDALGRVDASLAAAAEGATLSQGTLALASPTPSPQPAPTPVPATTAVAATTAHAPAATRSLNADEIARAATPTLPGSRAWLVVALLTVALIGGALVGAIVFLARTIAVGRTQPVGAASPSAIASPGPATGGPGVVPATTTLPVAPAGTLGTLVARADPPAARPAAPAAMPRPAAPTPEPTAAAATPMLDPAAAAWAELVKVADDTTRPTAERMAAVSKFINDNPASHPRRADADRLLARISDEAARERLSRPPDLAALGRVRKATYVGGTHAEIADETDGSFAFDRERAVFLVGGGVSRFVAIPYRWVTGIDYGLTDHIRGIVFKKKSHYLSLNYKDPAGEAQGIVLELGPDDFRPILTQLEARTGQKVRYQDEKAAKERWR